MARKGENIYKRKDGRWEGRYIKSRSSTGKANYGYVYAKSYREVKAKLISQSSCTSNSVTVDPEISSDQFEQVAMEWFQAICPKVKESTSNKYRNLLSSYILPVVADGLFCREIDGLFCRSSPDIIVRRRCVLSHKRRGWLEPSPSFRYSRNLALQDELYHPVINNGPAVLVCVDKRLGTGPVNQSRDAG